MRAFALARTFFDALARSRADVFELRVGPRLAPLFAETGIEPLEVRPFPVSISRLGAPEPAIWRARQAAVEADLASATDSAVREAGADYLHGLAVYEQAAASAGAGFVELQSTLLFAVVGQRTGPHSAA